MRNDNNTCHCDSGTIVQLQSGNLICADINNGTQCPDGARKYWDGSKNICLNPIGCSEFWDGSANQYCCNGTTSGWPAVCSGTVKSPLELKVPDIINGETFTNCGKNTINKN
jgi:hypothetical protein